jgi:hypothetical protein
LATNDALQQDDAMTDHAQRTNRTFRDTLNDYQQEQLAALELVRGRPDLLEAITESLAGPIAAYRLFRQQSDQFLQRHFEQVCTASCYHNRLSACCTRDGIVVFFADVALNALASTAAELDRIAAQLREPNRGFKCVFLTEQGCLWRIKPIVCQMFLCDAARAKVFTADPSAGRQWEHFEAVRKTFTWPDRPVLFDHLEAVFWRAGLRSSLMHLHVSPGLLRIKRQAGLVENPSESN